MTTLPRIAPRETPVSAPPIREPKQRNLSATATSLPAPAVSISMNGKPVPATVWARVTHTAVSNLRPHQFPRLNPLNPRPYRRTVSLETTEAHHLLSQRVMAMKQREHYRFHSGWQKPFYGSPADKEAYRRDIRSKLKEQMTDKLGFQKQILKDKVHESEVAVDYDRKCLEDDHEDVVKKAIYLKQFRDENKKLMEWKEEQDRLNRVLQNKYERELVRYNPINWSHTLT
ncbi:uncharacterized protein LOC100377244 [Saccoglossus kowalevskii]|uniref:Uncharacterized protein LOC100377244 n=1 Tax=Saccoglossus kowalevskii TaxID=10224 RepID=A0ABM0GXA4_SACKO|nr:PREDICTED: uncharacterized protein LOC100377244 [Saccoglossus kowalevskii]